MTRHPVSRWLRVVRGLVVLGVLGLGLLGRPPSARAGGFGLVAGGDEAKQPVVETELGPWLRAAGKGDVRIGTQALDARQITQIVNCFILADQACGQPAVATGDLDGLLFVMVEVERDRAAAGDRIKITGWLYGAGGAPIAAQSLFCNDCRNDTLKPKLEELARLLFVAASSGSGRLAVTTRPAGATVLVDGEQVGKTPLTLGLREGPHTVTIELDGHETVTRKIEIADETETPIEVELKPIGGAGGGGGRRSMRPFGYGALAAGGAAIIGGAVLMFVVDEEPVTTPTTDPTYTEATLPGAVMVGAGVALAAAGAYFVFRGEPERPRPVARVTGGGAVVGLTGRF